MVPGQKTTNRVSDFSFNNFFRSLQPTPRKWQHIGQGYVGHFYVDAGFLKGSLKYGR